MMPQGRSRRTWSFWSIRSRIPWWLIYFRGLIAPILVMGLAAEGQPRIVGCVIALAFLSDWLDGVIARRWNAVSPGLRRADSRADVAFYLSVVGTGVATRLDVLLPWLPAISGLLILEVICQSSNILRFGCMTATHAYLCKAWAVSLCLASIELLGSHHAGWLMAVCMVNGYVAYFDVLAILLILPVPAVDVPSALHAWRRRESYVSAHLARVTP